MHLQTLSAAVRSVEDHGYILDLGLDDVSGFLSFKEAGKAGTTDGRKFQIGHLFDVCVSKMSSNGRTCTVSIREESIRTAFVRSSTCLIANTLDTI